MKSRAQYRKGCARTLVLKILSERPMYGYEIATMLAQRSENIFSLGQGTLYPLLYSLEERVNLCMQKTNRPKLRSETLILQTNQERQTVA